MDQLSREFRIHFKRQHNQHPTWKNIQVILSDSNVPGEEEHKFMNFMCVVRGTRQRMAPIHATAFTVLTTT